MSLEPEQLEEAANHLRQAEFERRPIASLQQTYPDLDVEAAVKIQRINAKLRAQQERLVGYKVGLTSEEAQKQFRVFHPDFGHLFHTMEVKDGSELNVDALIQPRVEGELAFVLKRDLAGAGRGVREVLHAVECVIPAIEIVDSRIENWQITVADTIADNASSARFVMGSRSFSVSELDLRHVGMSLWCQGEVRATGAGAAVLGHPLEALVFLCDELAKHELGLRAGEIVLSGSLSHMLPASAGQLIEAQFGELGSVSVTFVSKEVGQ